ncbi:MAG: xylose isomerase, partial [Pseudomonadota bacterium]|nr:xylose isomerase [Pseudomonadota bacterium]
RLGLSRKDAQAHLLTHLGVCYDACHFALQYEQPARALARLADCGIRVGKTQLSAALKVALPRPSEGWCNLSERLRPFIESTYLHQVVERRQDGSLHHHADLCVKTPPHPDARDWRIHFHVPIFIDDYQTLHSTQHELLATLSALRENYLCSHLEIETYTWDILPPDLKMDLPASIEREYRWVLGVFADALPV